MQNVADAPTPGRTEPAWRSLARWGRVAALACLPFAVGLAAGVVGTAHLTSTLTPPLAAGILVLGVPLWFLVAEALAAVLRLLIKPRKLFVAFDAACGLGLLFLLYSLLIEPWSGAAIGAAAAGVCWWLVARMTHRAYKAAVDHAPLRRPDASTGTALSE